MSELKRDITLIGGIGQMSTTLLGTGLFMVPAIAASIAGENILWAWWLLIIAVCPIAFTFAALGKRYPNAGGASYFVKLAYGSRLEKVIALLFISVIPVGVPAAIAIAGGFAQQFLPQSLSQPITAQLIVVALLMVVNFSGSKVSSQFQTGIAIGVVVLVGLFVYLGDITVSDTLPQSIPSHDLAPIGQAIAVMFWCFVGIEAFAHMGEEFKRPERDYPIAILVGCLIAGAIYYLFSTVILKHHAYGTQQLNTTSVPYLSNLLLGSNVSWLINLTGFLACFATINLYTQSLSRMIWSLAREYRPDSAITRLSRKGVPIKATAIVGITLALSCLFGALSGIEIDLFLTLANGIFVMIYLFAMLSALKLLNGGGRYLAGLSIVLCVLVLFSIGLAALYAIGLFVFLWFCIPMFNTKRSQ
ncbi:L-methionine/branched-chain amino acid transporter [Vibrio sp. UCD-FRSSP16_10]|uniref:L-methionine/branched-chain amino acid transporter n=1 Tax=unclassified Vibrio TaxID=2614977 RepID=UPI0007FC08E3|nr:MULTISPECIES: L-methionine/branched-chain amino acid transporter [unclassified Vibrio]OBT14001.1 L-methionine/branched-chain amino acid transporter [Vibrio sp. UCD-FRSSP16_30]OBT22882.1 L-methionine/branched-chain amino acid transporter [Vibrio sp. UCD-FRSSP16_10]